MTCIAHLCPASHREARTYCVSVCPVWLSQFLSTGSGGCRPPGPQLEGGQKLLSAEWRMWVQQLLSSTVGNSLPPRSSCGLCCFPSVWVLAYSTNCHFPKKQLVFLAKHPLVRGLGKMVTWAEWLGNRDEVIMYIQILGKRNFKKMCKLLFSKIDTVLRTRFDFCNFLFSKWQLAESCLYLAN